MATKQISKKANARKWAIIRNKKKKAAVGGSDKQKLGFVGEQVTKKHLLSKGLEFVESNFRRKYGEIDLIMKVPAGAGVAGRGRERLMFFEVKTVSRQRFDGSLMGNRPDISRETFGRRGGWGSQEGLNEGFSDYRPEDNVSVSKIRKTRRIIKIWLEENKMSESADWSFNIALVYLSKSEKKFYIKILWDVIL